MANLRTNNLSGEGGRNAYSGSLFFDGDSSYLALGSGVVPSFGTGDFTIEFWINQGVNASNYTILISLVSSTPSDRFEVAIHSSTIYVYTDTGTWRDTGYAPVSGVYEHIAFQRDYSGNTLKMYANGEEKWSVSNTRDYDEAWTTQIGSYASSSYGYFQGYISNLRICKGHRVYSSNYFTPPTSELKVHYISENDKTVLLCCQDSDDAAQEATGKTIIAYGYFGGDKGTGNLITNGLDWDGATDTESSTMPTNWAAGSGATAEYDTGGTSGGGANRMLRLYNDGSNSFINQEIPTVIGQRYFYNVWYRAKNSSLGVRISAGTSSGATTNLSDQYNVGSANTEDTRTGFFTATATTTHFSLRIVSGTNGASVYWDDVIVRAFNPKAPKVIPPFGVDAGNTFDGAISMNSSAWMYFPTGRTEERARGRAVFMGGSIYPVSPSYSANIDYVEMTTSGVGVRFGSLTTVNTQSAAFASSTRGINAGGQTASPDAQTNVIEFVTIATEGNGTNFGDLDTGHRRLGGSGHSSQTRGIITGGAGDSPGETNVIQYVTIASLGDATNFGDLLNPKDNMMSKNGSSTRMLICGGRDYTPSATATNVIEYITIATLGDSQNFGDLSNEVFAGTGCSSATRGIIAGGQTPTVLNTIDFVTIASLGDALDFGDLTATLVFLGGASNSKKGIFAGGQTPTKQTSISSIQIATTGNAVDFGDNKATDPISSRGTCSDSHGGLS